MKIVAVSIVVVLHILLFPRRPLFAAPLPPELVVSHETKQCAEIFGGDECMDCRPPQGWESLGYAYEVECPAGYTRIEGIEAECQASKSEFCCSEGHSGVHGDCEDLVVHSQRKQCAFVDDIYSIELPEGWDKRPESLASSRWFCPIDHDWVEGLDSVPEVGQEETSSGGGDLPCPGAALVGPAALGLWLSRNRKR
jgi:hypothetical protein